MEHAKAWKAGQGRVKEKLHNQVARTKGGESSPTNKENEGRRRAQATAHVRSRGKGFERPALTVSLAGLSWALVGSASLGPVCADGSGRAGARLKRRAAPARSRSF
eukprot:6181927-Pleurochrysis_carterae.AAC.1